MTASYQHYATHDESDFPHLWRGVVGAWAPCLGPSGTRLHDHSGRSNWGTLTNMDAATDWAVDGGQYSLDFDGVNDTITLGSPSNYSFERTDQITWSAWINPFNVTGLAYGIVDKSDLQVPNTGWSIVLFRRSSLTATAVTVFLTNSRTSEIEVSSPAASIVANAWQHIGVTYTGNSLASGISIFINGIEQAKTITANNLAGTIQNSIVASIASRDEGGGQFFPGRIADVAIWRRVLHANETRELYEIGRGGMYTPRRRRRAYFGPFFQAGWARGSNIILQPCGVS